MFAPRHRELDTSRAAPDASPQVSVPVMPNQPLSAGFRGHPSRELVVGPAEVVLPALLMKAVLVALLGSLRAGFRSRAALQLEVLALRHQLAVYQRCPTRPRSKVADRLLWAWLSRTWAGWGDSLVFVQPSTVIAWQRRRFRDHWARFSRARPGGPRRAKRSRTSSARCRAQTRPGALRASSVNPPSSAFPWPRPQSRGTGLSVPAVRPERYL